MDCFRNSWITRRITSVTAGSTSICSRCRSYRRFTRILVVQKMFQVGGLVYNAHGNRFAKELSRRDYVTGEMWRNKPPFRLALNRAGSDCVAWTLQALRWTRNDEILRILSSSAKDLSVDLNDCVNDVQVNSLQYYSDLDEIHVTVSSEHCTISCHCEKLQVAHLLDDEFQHLDTANRAHQHRIQNTSKNVFVEERHWLALSLLSEFDASFSLGRRFDDWFQHGPTSARIDSFDVMVRDIVPESVTRIVLFCCVLPARHIANSEL